MNKKKLLIPVIVCFMFLVFSPEIEPVRANAFTLNSPIDGTWTTDNTPTASYTLTGPAVISSTVCVSDHPSMYGDTLDAYDASHWSLYCDGATDVLRFPDDSDIEPTHEISVEAWFRSDDVTLDWRHVIVKGIDDAAWVNPWVQYDVQILDTDGAIAFGINCGGTLTRCVSAASTAINNRWIYVCGTYHDAAVDTIRLYYAVQNADGTFPVDLTAISQAHAVGGAMSTGDGFLTIAGYYITAGPTTGESWDGYIALTRISNIELTQAQAEANYDQHRNTVGTANVRFEVNFREGYSAGQENPYTEFQDASGYNDHGVLLGANTIGGDGDLGATVQNPYAYITILRDWWQDAVAPYSVDIGSLGVFSGRTYTLPDSALGYYWMAFPFSAGGEPPSEVGWFRVDTVKPTTVSLVSPLNGTSLYMASVVLDWVEATDATSGVAHYHIQVDDDSAFGSPALNTTASATSYTWSTGTATTYYWRVRADDNCGLGGTWSSIRYFYTVEVGSGVHISYYDLDGWGIDFSQMKTWIDGYRVGSNVYINSSLLVGQYIRINCTDYYNNYLFTTGIVGWGKSFRINSTSQFIDWQIQLISITLRAYALTDCGMVYCTPGGVYTAKNATFYDQMTTVLYPATWRFQGHANNGLIPFDTGNITITTAINRLVTLVSPIVININYFDLDGYGVDFLKVRTYINGTRLNTNTFTNTSAVWHYMNLLVTDYFNNTLYQNTGYAITQVPQTVDVQLQLVSTTLKAYDLTDVEIFGNCTWSDNFDDLSDWTVVSAGAGSYGIIVDGQLVEYVDPGGGWVDTFTNGWRLPVRGTLTVYAHSTSATIEAIAINSFESAGGLHWWEIQNNGAGQWALYSRLGGWALRDTDGVYIADSAYKIVAIYTWNGMTVNIYNPDGTFNCQLTGAYDPQPNLWRWFVGNYVNGATTIYDMFVLQCNTGYSKDLTFYDSITTLLMPDDYVFNGTAWNNAIRFQVSATITLTVNRLIELCDPPLIITSVVYSQSDTAYHFAVSCNKEAPPFWFRIYDNASLVVPTLFEFSGIWQKSTTYGWHNLTLVVGDDVGYTFNFTASYFVGYRYITFEFYSTIDGLGLDPILFQTYVNGTRVWDTSNYATTGRNVFIQVFDYYMNSFYSGISAYSRVIQIGLGYYEATFINNGENNVILNSTSDAYALYFDGLNDEVATPAMSIPQTFTISCWYYMTAWTGSNLEIFSNSWLYIAGARWDTHFMMIRLFFTNGTAWDWFSLAAMQLNVWYHLVFTRTGIGHTDFGCLWINGVLQSNQTVQGATSTANLVLHIGSMDGAGAWHMGYMSTVTLYSRAMAQTEVQFNYLNKALQNMNSLVLYLPMREGTGITCYDLSGYTRNSAISGATWISLSNAGFVPIKSIPVASHGASTIRMITKSYTLVAYGIRQDNSEVIFWNSTITVSDTSKTFTYKDLTVYRLYLNYYDLDGYGIDFITVKTTINATRVSDSFSQWLGSGHVTLVLLVTDYYNNIIYSSTFVQTIDPYYRDVQLQLVSTTLQSYGLTNTEIWGNVTMSDVFNGNNGAALDPLKWGTSGGGVYTIAISNNRARITSDILSWAAFYQQPAYYQPTCETMTVWIRAVSASGTIYVWAQPGGGAYRLGIYGILTGQWGAVFKQGGGDVWSLAGGSCLQNVWYKMVLVLHHDGFTVTIYNEDGTVNWTYTNWFDAWTGTWRIQCTMYGAPGVQGICDYDLFVVQGNTGYSKSLTFYDAVNTLLTPGRYVLNGTVSNALSVRLQTEFTLAITLNRIIKLYTYVPFELTFSWFDADGKNIPFETVNAYINGSFLSSPTQTYYGSYIAGQCSEHVTVLLYITDLYGRVLLNTVYTATSTPFSYPAGLGLYSFTIRSPGLTTMGAYFPALGNWLNWTFSDSITLELLPGTYDFQYRVFGGTFINNTGSIALTALTYRTIQLVPGQLDKAFIHYYDVDGYGVDFNYVKTWIDGFRVNENMYTNTSFVVGWYLRINCTDYYNNILYQGSYLVSVKTQFIDIQLQLVSVTIASAQNTVNEVWIDQVGSGINPKNITFYGSGTTKLYATPAGIPYRFYGHLNVTVFQPTGLTAMWTIPLDSGPVTITLAQNRIITLMTDATLALILKTLNEINSKPPTPGGGGVIVEPGPRELGPMSIMIMILAVLGVPLIIAILFVPIYQRYKKFEQDEQNRIRGENEGEKPNVHISPDKRHNNRRNR